MVVRKKTTTRPKKQSKPKKVNSMRGLNTTQQRMKHVSDMYSWGPAGVMDYSERHRVVIPETTKDVAGESLRMLPSQYDVVNHDIPRQDVVRYDIKSNDYVRVGGDSQKNIRKFANWGFPVLGNSFSNDELNTLKLYYEYPSRNNMRMGSYNILGLTTTSDETPDKRVFSMIEMSRHAMGDEPTLIHETLHAVRANDGIEIRDEDKDEAFVELDTLARLTHKGYKQMQELPGYYSYLTDHKNKMRQDRILLTGSENKRLSGRDATNRVAEVFHKTNIYRLRASEGLVVDRKGKARKKVTVSTYPEWLNRYFEIVTNTNEKLNIHMSFRKPVPIGEVVTQLKKKYPGLRKVNEWMDGRKKALYVAPIKVKSRSRTTLARTKKKIKKSR
jgi:hypothetical protein